MCGKYDACCRWEANIWMGKGLNKQIYLGGFEREELAAEAYDVAALKFKGLNAATNFGAERCAFRAFTYVLQSPCYFTDPCLAG